MSPSAITTDRVDLSSSQNGGEALELGHRLSGDMHICGVKHYAVPALELMFSNYVLSA
jgi:hypothetical protein